MANADDQDPEDRADRPQDPLVQRLRPDPSQPPEQVQTLEGLLGDSDRPGHRRLYFTAELDHYAEFRAEDVLSMAEIAPDQPPFLGEAATRVTLRRDATVDFTRSRAARPLDEFDLDIRLAASGGPVALDQQQEGQTFGCPDTQFFGCTQFCTLGAGCPGGDTSPDRCEPGTELTVCAGQITICRGACQTRIADDCETARTDCGTCSPTCRGTCGPTCRGTCGPTCGATCITCPTGCQNTCGPTCRPTCATCTPRCRTVGGLCDDPFTGARFTCSPRCAQP